MKIGVITLFPDMFQAITQYGVTGRAYKQGLIEVTCLNPRDFTHDKHQKVDERPFGGGPGMLMMVQPLRDAILKAKELLPNAKVIYLSPQGKVFNHNSCVELAKNDELIFILPSAPHTPTDLFTTMAPSPLQPARHSSSLASPLRTSSTSMLASTTT